MHFVLLPETLVLHIVRSIAEDCKYSSFLFCLRHVNSLLNEAVLHILFVERRLRPPTRYRDVAKFNMFQPFGNEYPGYSRKSYIGRYSLQGLLVKSTAQINMIVPSETIRSIVCNVQRASAMLNTMLMLPKFEPLRVKIRSDSKFSTCSHSPILSNIGLMVVSHVANAFLGANWYMSDVDDDFRCSEIRFLECYTRIVGRTTNIDCPSLQLVPSFWVLVAACEIGSLLFLKHLFCPTQTPDDEAHRALFERYPVSFLTVTAGAGHMEAVKYLLKASERLTITQKIFHLPVRAAIMNGDVDLVTVMLDQIHLLSQTAILNQAVGREGFSKVNGLVFLGPVKFHNVIGMLIDRHRHFCDESLETIFCAAYKLGDVKILQKAMYRVMKSSQHPFDTVDGLRHIFLIEGVPHPGHLECLRFVVDGKEPGGDPSWKRAFEPRRKLRSSTRGKAIESYCHCVLSANRPDLFLPAHKRYPESRTVYINSFCGAVDDAEHFLYDELLSRHSAVLPPSHPVNSVQRGALRMAIKSLNVKNAEILIRSGVRPLLNEMEVLVEWKEYERKREDFKGMVALLKKHEKEFNMVRMGLDL